MFTLIKTQMRVAEDPSTSGRGRNTNRDESARGEEKLSCSKLK